MARKPKKVKRIGIYGGAFNMPHYGHLICAEWVRQEFDLDVVLFATSGNAPNKPSLKDPEARHEMVVAAVAENEHFDATRVDLEHGGPGYTLLTVEAIREQYGEDAELFYLTSSEYLDPENRWFLPTWEGAKELFKLCTFLVFPRERTEIAKVEAWAKQISQMNRSARFKVLYVPSPELSSTLIRNLVKAGRSIRYLTPLAVQLMIAKKGLYTDPDSAAPTPSSSCTCQRPKQVKSLGIYGGRFDPINYRNLLCAEWARQEYALDRVLFVSSAHPTNGTSVFASAEDRHEMVVAAVSDNPHFEASRLDLDRHTQSYALLTVEQVREQYGADVELSFFLSSEYLNPDHPEYLPTWMGWEKLCKLCRFLIFPVDGADLAQIKEWAKLLPQARMEVMEDCPSLPVSAAMIRERVGKGLSIWYTTPWPIQKMIEKKRLYQEKKKPARRACPKK